MDLHQVKDVLIAVVRSEMLSVHTGVAQITERIDNHIKVVDDYKHDNSRQHEAFFKRIGDTEADVRALESWHQEFSSPMNPDKDKGGPNSTVVYDLLKLFIVLVVSGLVAYFVKK